MKRATKVSFLVGLIIGTALAAQAASRRYFTDASVSWVRQKTGLSAVGEIDEVARSLKSKYSLFAARATAVDPSRRLTNPRSLRTTQARDIVAETDEPDGLETRKRVEDHLVTVENLQVHYIESGSGQTVVMIHGNAGGVVDFELGVMQLLSSAYRVIAIDRPGHGRSDRPAEKGETVEYQAQLLHRTLSLLGIKQPVLIGHSWGAALALAYALKYPDEVSAMVLLAPAAYADKEANGVLRTIIRTPVLGDLSLLLGRSIMGRRRLKHDLARAFYPEKVPQNYFKIASSTWLGRKQLRAYLEDEWSLNASLKKMSKRYPDIRIPVVIVIGAEDQIVSPKENAYRLQSAIHGSRLIELKNAGHEIPQTHPESVYAALRLISSSATE